MDDDVRRRREMFGRVKQFQIDNPPTIGTIAATQSTVLSGIVGSTDVSTSSQAEGILDAGSAYDVKATRRENLRDLLFAISRTARSMEYAFDGIAARYRMPPNQSDANIIATGHAFHTNSAADEANFIAYGMDAAFRTTLNTLITDFESSTGEVGSAVDQHVEATATSKSQVREGMIAVRILDGYYKNIFANNPGKLAAWISASHVEAAPKKNSGGGPTPTPPDNP